MIKLTNKLYGASLVALAFSLNVADVKAQTCTPAPTCETLGFTKSSADCDGKDALKCPFDQTKLFCPSGGGSGSADDEEAIAVGHIAYSDGTTSSVRKAGKTPIGVIFNVSGLAVALENASNEVCSASECSQYSVAGLSAWKTPTLEYLKSIKTNLTAINATLKKLSATTIGGDYYYNDVCSKYTVSTDNGYGVRCYIDISTINATPITPTYKVGDTYMKDGVACGKVAALDSTGQHGTVVSSATVSGASQSEANQNCNAKTICGLDWGISSCENAKAVNPTIGRQWIWTSSGCKYPSDCDSCGIGGSPENGYCQATF